MSGQTVSMKKLAFLLSVSVGMSTGAVTVPLLYPPTLPQAQAYCLEEPAAVPACLCVCISGWKGIPSYGGGCSLSGWNRAAMLWGVRRGLAPVRSGAVRRGTGSHPAACIKATPCCLKKTVRRILCGQFLFGNYLAATAAAAIVTATAVVAATVAATAIAAANEQQDQNDDPPAAVTTKTASTTHNSSTPLNKM